MVTYRQRPTTRRDSLEEIYRSVFILPCILTTLCSLCQCTRDPLQSERGRCDLAFLAYADESFNHICRSLAWR